MLPKPTNPADPVNEPCYTHHSCRGYDPATGPTDVRPAICCVKVGTCDGITLSGNARWYEGGCVPFFQGNKSDGTPYTYYVDSSWNVLANTSTSTNFPTSTEGCVKQGECALPYVEQIGHFTSRGSPNLEMGALSAETMDRLLANAIEAYPDACRDADLYPHMAPSMPSPPLRPFDLPTGIEQPVAYYALDEGAGFDLKESVSGKIDAGKVIYDTAHQTVAYDQPNWVDVRRVPSTHTAPAPAALSHAVQAHALPPIRVATQRPHI